MKHRVFGTVFVLAFIVLMMNGIYAISKMSKPPFNSSDFSHAEIQQEFESALAEWKENQNLLEVYDISLKCTVDELLLKRDLNQRAYQNIFLYVDVFHEPIASTKEAMDNADQAYQSIYDCLTGNTEFGKYIYTIQLNPYAGEDETGLKLISREMHPRSKGDNTQVEISEEEKAAQTIAYDYAKEMRKKKYLGEDGQEQSFGSPSLIRFGIDSSTGELVIEFDMSTPSEDDMESLFYGLDTCGKELCQLLKGDKNAAKYIKDHNVSTAVVRFAKPKDYEDHYYEARYEL